jgi:hypothetical protein
MTYERIYADEIKPGDYVARARTHPFKRVVELGGGSIAVVIHYLDETIDRPRRTARWWREAR